ncbi:MAG: hypothetical protein ACFCUU_13445 [Cyclobacteriaceae bacterium]
MKVFVNDVAIVVFEGAKVKDAVLKTDRNSYQSFLSGVLIVRDSEGNELMPNGQLSDEVHIYFDKNTLKL